MKVSFILIAVGLTWLGLGNVCLAQTAPADLSPDVQEVLTLSRQHMDDSVITNYIISTGKTYKLSADDIIYLNSQGVSQGVITALLQTSANNSQNAMPATTATAPAITPTATAPEDTNAVSSPEPPPLDGSASSVAGSASSAPDASASPVPAPPQISVPPMIPAPLQDNFSTDGGLNPSYWQTQSPLLTSLAAMNGVQVLPSLSFSPTGMQMSGIGGPGQFMGIQSTAPYAAPFSFSATVTGLSQDAVPFEIYLVSSDLQQWLSVAGHLGGRGHPRGEVHVGVFSPLGGVGVGGPVGGGNSPDYGVWVNHTGSGQPISALGDRLYPYPTADIPYTIQVTVGADGLASVALLDAKHGFLASESVPVGTGPFYVVLAGRNGPVYAQWQSVQVTPSAPVPAIATAAPAPPPAPDLAYFQQQLTPYGTWVTVPGYGLCWEPAVGPDWRPYYDGGHWEYTDAGYFWQSDYPWGDIVFHYGRWAYVNLGVDPCWVWQPGYDYAPAWVVWRHDDADGYIGWAPLPPGAVFLNGDWFFHGARVGVDFDFGLGAGFFTFVAYDHFWAHDYRPFIVPHDRVDFAWHHSEIINHYGYEHGVVVNVGLSHDRMAVFTHNDFHPTPMAGLRHDEEMHNAMQRDNDLHSWNHGAPNAWGPGHGGGQNGGQYGHPGGWH